MVHGKVQEEVRLFHVHHRRFYDWFICVYGNEFKDIENSEGGASKIPDESYCVQHDHRGVLSMANNGKHCNESEFIVCLKSNPWMNYYYVAFGQLVDGAGTLKKLENISTYYEQPTKQIVISHCGEYIFGDEIKLETESKIFLEHQPPMSTEGEATRFSDSAFDFYSITPWLDNIADRIDVRDTASLLMAERYLHGLYCLSTDYLPGMDMRPYAEIRSIAKKEYDTIALKLRELLLKFQPDTMTEGEKLMFTSDISKIILAYVFCQRDNEFCLKHISMDSHAIIHKILEVAYEIALRAVAKSKEKALIARGCAASKLIKMFEEKQAKCIPISDACISLLEELLIKAILHLTRFIDRQEE
ncbi:uncharacterized protein LOC143367551 isoform X2 [Andrena cerasifolii]|uniref:uncharacterized protein LOC143367551 isoform X2 n=1 Tax=Andrena cerasifolii TaxID=2819439 RepID=UPI00403820FA